jgi:DNA helicase-2/ATP-dependent DNA helicase PcrA
MKILLSGPGTGKTTKVKTIIKNDYPDATVQVISFTNATINDLSESFKAFTNIKCSTLHSYALKINHLPELHILNDLETKILNSLSQKIEIPFLTLCDLLKCITFDRMIESCLSFLKRNPKYAEDVIGNLDLLIVDEFQDFNPTEQKLIFEISKNSKETFILGDDDQSIYSFKDADPDGIITLYKSSEIEKIMHENLCFRCPDSIVNFCSRMIRKNKHRIDKPWIPTNRPGELNIQQTTTLHEADLKVLDLIRKIKEVDNNASILILSPVEFAIKNLRAMLYHNDIKYFDFWNRDLREEIQIKIWWLKAIFTNTKVLNLIFLAGFFKLFSNQKFKKMIIDHFRKDIMDNQVILDILKFNPLSDYSIYFTDNVDINSFFDNNPNFKDLQPYLNPENIENSIENLTQIFNPKAEFKKGNINLMSIHKSKGLESEYVIILGLVDGILPNKKRGLDTIEAQRRLLFVGMTRTLKELNIISSLEWDASDIHKVDDSQFKFAYWRKKTAKVPKSVGKISSFIEEID